MKVLLQICNALIVDLSHVVCGPCLLLLKQVETSGLSPVQTLQKTALMQRGTRIKSL